MLPFICEKVSTQSALDSLKFSNVCIYTVEAALPYLYVSCENISILANISGLPSDKFIVSQASGH
jgi:hypothetical protein